MLSCLMAIFQRNPLSSPPSAATNVASIGLHATVYYGSVEEFCSLEAPGIHIIHSFKIRNRKKKQPDNLTLDAISNYLKTLDII